MIDLIGDTRITDAASSLAKLAFDHKAKYKAIVFDIDNYMEVVIGKGLELPKNIEDVTGADYKRHQDHRNLRKQFINALSAAFTIDDVARIAPCLLTEIGLCELAGVEGNWYQVTIEPVESEMFILTL